jgi:capsule polysaccharide modification protein KpsS
MRRILYLVQVDVFVPFICQLSRYLAARGYEPHFASFLPREQLWLRKNNIRANPNSVYAVRNYPIRENLFDAQQIDEILGFAIQKSGGKRQFWEERLLRVASVLSDVLDSHEFDAVVIWNGEDFVGKALTLLARRRGIKTVFGENGYFPNTLQFDLDGVNVHSSVTNLRFADILQALQEPEPGGGARGGRDARLGELRPLAWTDFLRCFVARKSDLRYYRHFPEHRGGSWFTSQWLRIKRSLVPHDRHSVPEKFILIPFQVHDDTQILLNSRHFKTMEEFFQFCHAAIKRNFGDEYRIVVKEHPEDLCRHSYARLRHKYPDVLWFRKCRIEPLLERAAYVFVVNSSVGLQALQRGKPTLVFGESFYSKNEIVFRVEDPARIDEVIAQARRGMTPDRKDNIEKFIRFLNERYFVSGGWKNVTAAGVAGAGERIRALIE